jgi:hypothetical protein
MKWQNPVDDVLLHGFFSIRSFVPVRETVKNAARSIMKKAAPGEGTAFGSSVCKKPILR